MNSIWMYGFFIGLIIALGLAIFYIFNKKWIDFGMKLRYYRGKYKQHLGFMWVRDSGNNFDLPKFIDLRTIKDTEQENTFVYGREQLLGTTLFGRPFVMYDNDDNKTSLGLYVQEQDEKGEPKYHESKAGFIVDKFGNKVPMITQRKGSITLPPDLFQAVVTQEVFKNLKNYINNFMGKYKIVLFIVGGIGIGLIAILYLQYEQKEILMQALEACKAVVA